MDIQGYSARYLLFNRRYLVKVRNIDIIDPEVAKHRGLPYTGIKSVDLEFANQLIDKYLTVAELAELYQRGISVRFPKKSDVEEMYTIICKHIHDFKTKINSSINVTNVPVEDLNLLSEFASKIYDMIGGVKDEEKITEVPNDFANSFKHGYLDPATFFKPTPVEKPLEEVRSQVKEEPKREETQHEKDMKEINDKIKYRRQQWTPR